MPKDTFFNLPKEKQEKLMEVAIEEFAKNGYQKCSIQTIADRAGVAKGSMYQYFDSKKELFFYILDLAGQKKMEIASNIMKGNPNQSFFDLMEAMFIIGMQFAAQHPELYRIYQDIQKTAPHEIRKEFDEKIESIGRQYYKDLINKAIKQGDIRKDIDDRLISFTFYTLLKSFSDFLLEITDLSDDAEHKKYIRQFIEVIKNGIKSKGGTSND